MFAHFFSFVLFNVYINLVASNPDISTDSSIPVMFKSNQYSFSCLTQSSNLGSCNCEGNVKFYIEDLTQINQVNADSYPITNVKKISGNGFETAFERIRFEKFADTTWLFVRDDKCLTVHENDDDGVISLRWLDCDKSATKYGKPFPKQPMQQWNIINCNL
jgi:hypothetical protein